MAASSESGASTPVISDNPPRKRAKHTRSRLGCKVCRIRRIRCDQKRPSCDRCSSTGRICDGYPSKSGAYDDQPGHASPSGPDQDSLAKVLLCLDPDSSLPLDLSTRRSLYYFQHKAASELTVFFYNDLWSTLVLQVSRREECVREVVVALALLHESFHANNNDNLTSKAISQYLKGVKLLNNHISTHGWAALEITLLCSILCVTFEWLRGDYPAAHTHLRSSISIISRWHANANSAPNTTSLWSPSGYLIRNKLRPVYISLVLQARTKPIEPDWPPELLAVIQGTGNPDCFSSLQEAKESLDLTLAYILPGAYRERVVGTIRNQEDWDLVSRLAGWAKKFDDFLETRGFNDAERSQVSLMRLWHITSRVLLAANISGRDEGVFDCFMSDFKFIVCTAERLLVSLPSYFFIDMGVVPLLFYTALKCRHPGLRRRAIKMLAETPRRESVWDSIGASLVLKHIIGIEEDGLDPQSLDSEADIPVSARVCHMNIYTDVEHRTIQMKVKRPVDEDWVLDTVFVW